MALNRDQFLAKDDLLIKEVTFPASIPKWGGETIFIRALTRGEQDAYSKRQMGDARMKTSRRESSGEISMASMFGHDAWLVLHGACDENGKPLFKESDMRGIEQKNGEAVGWLARQIVIFSGMGKDEGIQMDEPASAEQVLKEELKN
jgi:hypothetical protein